MRVGFPGTLDLIRRDTQETVDTDVLDEDLISKLNQLSDSSGFISRQQSEDHF